MNCATSTKWGSVGTFQFPKLHEPVTKDHMRSLLEKAWEFSWPNLVVAHSQDAVTAVCLLQELHTNASLRCLKMETDAEAGGKTKRKLSVCPFYQYFGSNNLSYLNHIICAHYNVSYGCGKCLNKVFPTGQWLTVHIKALQKIGQRKNQPPAVPRELPPLLTPRKSTRPRVHSQTHSRTLRHFHQQALK